MFNKGVRRRVALFFSGDPGKTKQSMSKACDVNRIMDKFEKTGLIEYSGKNPTYGDFSNVGDYQSALNKVIEAREAFGSLSAKVRARFGNNPAELISFLADPKNLKESVELGLRPKELLKGVKDDEALPKKGVADDSAKKEPAPKEPV